MTPVFVTSPIGVRPHRFVNLFICAVLAGLANGCSHASSPTAPSGRTDPASATRTLVSVSVEGGSCRDGANCTVPGTQSLAATAHFSDGTTRAVTSSATWESSDEDVATVNQGLLTSHTEGVTDITAAY